MRRAASGSIAFAAALLVPLPPIGGVIAQGPPPIPPATTAPVASLKGAIAGRVVDGTTGTPIRDAVVTLSGRGAVTPVLTDANGRFAFDGLTTGPLTVTAMKNGHYGGLSGQRRPTGPPQSLQLGDGERILDVTLRLWRFAAITGTVLDELGEPVVGLSVWAYPKALVAGRPVINSSAGVTARTDDRGVFRIARLQPGSYVVGLPLSENAVPLSMVEATARAGYAGSPNAVALSRGLDAAGMDGDLPGSTYLQVIDGLARSYWNNTAVPPPPDVDGRIQAYAATYFSGANAPGLAQPIVLAPGDERAGVDFRLRLVPTVRVSGRLTSRDGPAANVALRLVPTGADELTADLPIARTLSDARGVFTFLAVPPGQYEARISTPVRETESVMQQGVMMTTSPGTLPVSAWWTNTPVSVGTTDVKDLQIPLHRGVSVSGRVQLEPPAATTADQLRRLMVRLERADGRSDASGIGIARVDDQGRFQTNEMPPGQYVVRITSAPSAWSAQVGGRDVSVAPIDLIDRDLDNLIITLGLATTQVSGFVRAALANLDPDTLVFAFSTDRTAWTNYGRTAPHMQRVRADRDGGFTIWALPAGEYYVAAMSENAAPVEWTDPAFLAKLSATAATVRLTPGSAATVSVQPGIVR